MYYLETNALRGLGQNLLKISPECFTSAFSMLELVSGIKDSDYRLRRLTLVNISKAKLKVMWKLPDQLIAEAFPNVIQFVEHRVEDLKTISTTILHCENFETFQKSLQSQSLQFGLKFFQNYDVLMSKRFNESIKDGNQMAKNIDEESQKLLDTLHENPLNVVTTLEATVWDVCTLVGQPNNKPLFQKLLADYQQNINVYMYGFSYYSARKLQTKEFAKTNDYADIYHLLYLRSFQHDTIITNDKMITQVIKDIDYGKVMSIESFKELN